MPQDDCWILEEETISDLRNNEILIETKYLSVDPYMRGRMNDSASYAPPVKIGEPMTGETVGEVIESRSKNYKIGDIVCIHRGWQTHIKAKDSDLTIYKVPNSSVPISCHLGVVGMPGRTAYFGFKNVGKPKTGETIVVSAASGAVGSVVGQLAISHGCNVIGIAGGEEKCAYVKDVLNFNHCLDYKKSSFVEELNKICNDGVDIYFENVGGEVTKAVAQKLNPNARVPICGFISQYNESDVLQADTPFNILGNLEKKPNYRFFLVTEWMNKWSEASLELISLIESGSLKYKETITKGFENTPQAFRDVLSGKNFGKQVVEI